MSGKPKVLVAVLSHTGWIHSSMLKAVFDILTDERVEAEMLLAQMTPVEYARNSIIKYAIAKEKDWILSIDHDNAPVKNPIDLLFLGKDLIFCPTPMHVDEGIRMNCFIPTGYKKGEGLQEAHRVGSGCFVMSKKVWEAIEKPWFQFIQNEDGKTVVSEDINFCDKARKAGIVPYVHTDYPCHHFHEVDLWEIVNEYKRRE